MSAATSRHSTTIRRPLPNGVIYDLSKSDRVTITLPAGSTWSSGLHWHERHVEYLAVQRGAILVRLNDVTRRVTAADGEIRVDCNVWHEWRRAEPTAQGDVVVVERTEPVDGEKALFFWNLNGVILRAQSRPATGGTKWLPKNLVTWIWDVLVTWQLFVIFAHLDNIPVFLNVPQIIGWRAFATTLDRSWSHLVLFVASTLGGLVGIQSVNRDFTPEKVYEQWRSDSRKGSKAQ